MHRASLHKLFVNFSLSSFQRSHSSKTCRYFSTEEFYEDAEKYTNYELMQTRYSYLKKLIYEKHEQKYNIGPRALFAVNQLNLHDIHVYGFDYDYTLAQYSDIMQDFIYKEATKILVKKYHFPKKLLGLQYQPKFCIRGLHYDIPRSLLMKVDICNVIQFGTVHRGLQKLTDSKVLELLGSRHIPKQVIEQSYVGGESLRQLMDIFSLPEMMLLANVVEYFDQEGIRYDPRILFENVQYSVRDVHISGLLYNEVSNNIEAYLVKNSLCDLINHLTNANRKLFLITNSNFHFVDTGMRHLLGFDWQDAFDVVIVEAKKPNFFKTTARPFKTVVHGSISSEMTISWDRITEFKKGEVYCEGCLDELMKLSKWDGTEVLYFGDQIYADLSDLSYSHGWRTGAVIPELEEEIDIMNSKVFGETVIWIQTLERLLERMQVCYYYKFIKIDTNFLSCALPCCCHLLISFCHIAFVHYIFRKNIKSH